MGPFFLLRQKRRRREVPEVCFLEPYQSKPLGAVGDECRTYLFIIYWTIYPFFHTAVRYCLFGPFHPSALFRRFPLVVCSHCWTAVAAAVEDDVDDDMS